MVVVLVVSVDVYHLQVLVQWTQEQNLNLISKKQDMPSTLERDEYMAVTWQHHAFEVGELDHVEQVQLYLEQVQLYLEEVQVRHIV